MKSLTIIITVFLFACTTFAQGNPDSLQNREQNREKQIEQNQNQGDMQNQEQIKNQEQNNQLDRNRFGDQNRTGMPEEVMPTLGNRNRNDVFIDKDGDGICDNRASGMSFNKMRKRMQGKNQHGSGSGNHGNGSGNGGM
ncbi:MAG: hypothetical protein Kow0098_07040 [Ignavibacteriaceae bacterium]